MGLPDLTFQLYVDSAWTTYPATWSEGWSTRIGPDIETGTQPNQIALTLPNDDGSMDPSNVSSALYGKIGQNTPCRMLDSGTTLTRAEATTWEPDETVEHNVSTGRGRAWVTLTAGGLLQRLGRWEDPLDSPMTRQTSSYASLTGHMPLEDPSGSSTLSQLVPKVKDGYFHNSVTFAGDPGAGGSGPCLLLGSDGIFGGFFRTPSNSGYQVCWAAKLSALPGSATYQTILQWTDTLGRVWKWQVNNANHSVAITDADGTAIDSIAFGYSSIPPNQWIRYRVKVTVSGGTLTYEPAVYVQDASFSAGVTRTFASSSTGQPKGWSVTANTYIDGAAYTCLFAVTDTGLNLLTGDPSRAFNGYLGERAAYRYARLMGELGLTGYGAGDAALTAPMGRQKPGRALDLIQECVTTDGGLLYDEPLDIALTFRYANDMVGNPSTVLALTKGTNVAPPLKKIIGDVGTVNDVTVTNWDGSTARLEQDTGPKSVSPPPAGVGRYKLPLSVSTLFTEQMIDCGDWALAQGTLNRPRYKQVVVNLLASPSLRATINGMRPGDLVSLSGVEPDTIYLRAITIERMGSDTEDKAVLSCLPADVWRGGLYDDGVARYDSASTTLGTSRDTTQTSWSFSTSDRADVWSTTSTPYDVLVTGERMTVTSMGAVTGTGPWTQTATVTRSVNGVVKSHSSGEEIHVFQPGRYAIGGW